MVCVQLPLRVQAASAGRFPSRKNLHDRSPCSDAVPPPAALPLMFLPLVLLLALPLIHAAAVPNTHDFDDHNHSHDVRQSLPTNWYQARDHPVHKLFKRAPGDGTNYAPVGDPGR